MYSYCVLSSVHQKEVESLKIKRQNKYLDGNIDSTSVHRCQEREVTRVGRRMGRGPFGT